MAEDLALNDHHSEMIGSYLRFAKFRRGRHLRTVEQTFEDTKLSRLVEGTFTSDEVREMLDELCALLKGDLEMELINTAHTAALLLCQMGCQAQQWHLKLHADISELENRDMLEKVNKFEQQFTNNSANLESPLRVNKLQPLAADSSGSSKLLQMEIERLSAENKKLSDKLKEAETHAIEVLEQKSTLSENLVQAQRELKEWRERKAQHVEKDLKNLEDEMLQVKKELETTMCESAFTQQNLECDLMETKQRLMEVQSQLQLAEKELDLKFSQTGAFKNMKQILSTKNEQIKTLRQRLSQYENGNDDAE